MTLMNPPADAHRNEIKAYRGDGVKSFIWIMSIAAGFLMTAAVNAAGPELPASATGRVDFEAQIKPILQARCLSCHGRGKLKGGLSIETRETLLRGGETGPAMAVGKSAESLLIQLAAGIEPDRKMPAKGEPLSSEQIGLIRGWIDQGAKWPEGFTFGFRKAPIAPRTPTIPVSPAGLDLENPIDRFLAEYSEKNKVAIEWRQVDSRTFARRASLDLIGLLPTPEQIDAFEKDPRPDKTEQLVRKLLSEREAYADHWLSFWNDALRNAYKGTGFIDGGRKTITKWLYQALYDNMPYDRFVRELIDPPPGAEGFTKGIVWRGVVNASQAPPVQAAQNVTQVFMGTNLKCASCHDSFVNHWKLTDAYALASVFSEKPLELHRCEKPTGQTSAVAFIYPELGKIDAAAPRKERMKQLSEILVKPENGRFSRTIVNRLWAHMMGRGIVEPLDDLDQVPWEQDLLDWLASDLVAHGHDLKHTLELIATSRAYRLASVGVPDPSDRGPYVFKGPFTKRMMAEQYGDALSALTGIWPEPNGDMLKVDGRGQGGQISAIRQGVGHEKESVFRAALAFDDPLLVALGRSSREQVVTRRDGVATTLQALELTNGITLDNKLRSGAERWVARSGIDPESLVRQLWLIAFGRIPADAERAAALELSGRPATVEGVQDLLWSMTMLPEFQLIP